MLSNNFFSGIKFYDDLNYPRGFSRSGDFTILESEILTECGHVMKKLIHLQIPPENEEQEHFLQVINGKAEASSLSEKVYLKYLNLLQKKNSCVPSVKRAAQTSYSAYAEEGISFEE